jgi:hypothetical protein
MGSYLKYPGLIFLWMVALMSGSFSIFRELYGIYSGTVPQRTVFWSCAQIAFIISACALWAIEHREKLELLKQLDNANPKFTLLLESIIWIYDPSLDTTVFVLAGGMRNAGAASAAFNWHATYSLNDASEEMTPFYVRSEWSIPVGPDLLTLTNAELLMSKLMTKLEKGDARFGRLIFTVPGNRTAQVQSAQYKITVTCRDIENREILAVFVPSGKPLVGTRMFPGERLQEAVRQVEASKTPELSRTA